MSFLARALAVVVFVLVAAGVTFWRLDALELLAAGLALYALSDFLPD